MNISLMLKEWSSAIKFFQNYKTSLIFRKGGIHEKNFKDVDSYFGFFPTFEHESRDTVKKDFQNKIIEFADAFAILLDSGGQKIRGGTGKTFDWKLIPKEIKNNLIIAGGLNSNNITSLIKSYKPYGVDLASGVESKPGKKEN